MRLRPALTVVVIATLLLGFLAPARGRRRASAARPRSTRRMRDLRHDLNETSARAAGRGQRCCSAAESKLPAARARVARVHGRLVAAQARDRLLGEQLEVAKAEVAAGPGPDQGHQARHRGQPGADRPDRPLVLPGRRHGRARRRAAVPEPRRLRHPAGPGAERDALRGQRARPAWPRRGPTWPPQKATLVAKREQVAGDEARAGGAGRADPGPAGRGHRRPRRRSQ